MLDERDDIEIFDASEEETEREAQRHQMRKERAQKMQEEKQRSIKRQRYILLGFALVILFFLLIVLLVKHTGKKNPKDISANVVSQQTETQADAVAQETETEEPWSFEAHKTEKTEKSRIKKNNGFPVCFPRVFSAIVFPLTATAFPFTLQRAKGGFEVVSLPLLLFLFFLLTVQVKNTSQ